MIHWADFVGCDEYERLRCRAFGAMLMDNDQTPYHEFSSWCATHGMTVTPRDRRYPRLHDQHDALVAALTREVANEMRPIQRTQDRTMPPLNFRVWV